MSLLDFLSKAKTNFHASNEIKKILLANGYSELAEGTPWKVSLGDKVFIERNNSAIIALNIPQKIDELTFNLCASHTDSPTFKVKPSFDLTVCDYQVIDTEPYSEGIYSTWMDRPLSLAGRAVVKQNGVLTTRLFDIDEDLLIIPNMPIHFQRNINSGYTFNAQVDMLPIAGEANKGKTVLDLMCQNLNCDKDEILSHEMALYIRDRGALLGANKEFICGPQLDDLASAYGTLMGFVSATPKTLNVYCAFDNEETGSMTKQGAFGTFLTDVLTRICASLGFTNEEFRCAVAKSFLISCDNAHAIHPNHTNMYEQLNRVYMNKGIVIKTNVNQKYTSDAVSVGIMKEFCNLAKVKWQMFANRSDVRGGSTLGNISNVQLSINSVDIGLPQLAMHSSYETMGKYDLDDLISLMKVFFSSKLVLKNGKEITLI